MSFFGATLTPGCVFHLPAGVRLTQAALAAPPQGASVSLCTVGGQLVCHLSDAAMTVRLCHLRGPVELILSSNGPGLTHVHVCGLRNRREADSVGTLSINHRQAECVSPEPSEELAVTEGTWLEQAGTLAKRLLRARRAVLLKSNPQACAERLRGVVSEARHQRAEATDIKISQALDEVVATADDALKMVAASAPPASSVGSHVRLRLLVFLDGAFFRLLKLCITESDSPLHMSPTGSEPGLPDESSGVGLLRWPASFFLRSHSANWTATQRGRWRVLLGAQRGAHGPSTWLDRIVDAQCAWLTAPDNALGTDNQLMLFWRARQLEAAALLHAGGVSDPHLYADALPPSSRSTRDADPPAP
jgi:hypothetical protein